MATRSKASLLVDDFKLCSRWLMSSRSPPLESLRVFEAAARHVNFSGAALELGVTPAAVSLRMRDLEADLGTQLFIRVGPRIHLTPAGALLLAHLSSPLAAIAGAVDEVRAARPSVRVTANSTLAAQWLSQRLTCYMRLKREVAIVLDVSDSLNAADGHDVWLRSGVGPWPGLEGRELFPMSGTPMLNPDLASSLRLEKPDDLARASLLPDERWPAWFMAAGMQKSVPTFRAAVSYPTQSLAASAAVAGAGVALLSPTLFRPFFDDGRLLAPFPTVITGPGAYHLLRRTGETRPHVLQFVAWLCSAEAEPQTCGELHHVAESSHAAS